MNFNVTVVGLENAIIVKHGSIIKKRFEAGADYGRAMMDAQAWATKLRNRLERKFLTLQA